MKITSRDNQRIKLARKVRDGFVKDAIFVEGLRLAEEVLRSDLNVSDVLFSGSFAQTERHRAFLQRAENYNGAEVSEKIFDSISDTKTSQGVVLIADKPETGRNIVESNLQKKKQTPLLVLLHQINNPTNLGAVLRTAEAANVSGIITTRNSANLFSPKALRGAMGASLRLSIWENADFSEALAWAKEKKIISTCADVNAEKSYTQVDWKAARLMIFGSEAHGLSAEEREQIDENLIIPMDNKVESLNLAVACGIILFEAKKQKDD
ncbi:MAG: RNA methyltransferase [Acidobacteriota bacterium]|nr:RNA methyltransferase [Acidobacteriota bacterium]MDQ3374366.1 RNA methyltransferase [Acidobacteriota bacterium]